MLGFKEMGPLYTPETEEYLGEMIILHDSTRKKRTDSSLFKDIVGCSTSSGDAVWLISSLGLIDSKFHQ